MLSNTKHKQRQTAANSRTMYFGHHHRPLLLACLRSRKAHGSAQLSSWRKRPAATQTTVGSVRFASSSSADVVPGPRLLRTSVRHRPRPSLLHLPGLRALPFWTVLRDGETQTAYRDESVMQAVHHLESHSEAIMEEYQTNASRVASDYQTDTEHSKLHDGTWEWRSYLRKGIVEPNFAAAFPTTAGVLQLLRQQDMLFDGTPFGYAFFSTLQAKSSIQPHTAPMNLRLRVHLPLQVPTDNNNKTGQNDRPVCGIRVGTVIREWTEGRAMVLDDCFEHEVWNDTDKPRVLLLVDLWHPDVTASEKEEIRNMFRDASEKGWLS